MNRFLIFSLSAFCILLLAGGCSDSSCISDAGTPVPLQLEVSTVSGSPATRSIVSQTGTAAGQVNQIGVYLTLNSDGHTVYGDPVISSALFTLGTGDAWTASRPVNLRTTEARLYAWYPADDPTATTDNGSTRTVPVTLLGSQAYDGSSTTACSQTDYLYGSSSDTPGTAVPVTVNRDNSAATIYLQHALSQLVFTIEYKSGRVPDAEYDWVKSISLEGPFHTGAGTMQLNDGTLAFPAQSSATLAFEAESNPKLPGSIGTPEIVAYGLVAPKASTTGTVTVKLVLGQQNSSGHNRTLTTTTDLFNAEWKKNVRYVYNLLLDKNDITLETVTIEGWTEDSTGGSTVVPPVTE